MLQLGAGRDARGPGPRVRRLGDAGSSARSFVASTRARPPLHARPRRPARSSSARRSARPTAAGRSTARSRPRARSCASRRYRHGGGRGATSPRGTLTVLQHADPRRRHGHQPATPAAGGVDAERSTRARQRAAMEIRSRYRAVTAEDFEFLAGEASPRVARARLRRRRATAARCRVHIVPRVDPADRRLHYDELVPDEDLLAEVAAYLDERRLIGTTVQLLPCRFRGLSRRREPAGLAARRPRARRGGRRARALHVPQPARRRLRRPGPARAGRSAARSTRASSTASCTRSRASSSSSILRIYETNLDTGEQAAKPAGTHIVLEPDELLASGQHIVKATHRGGRRRSGRWRRRQRRRRRVQRPSSGRRLRHADDPVAGGRARHARGRLRRARTCAAACPAVYQESDFGMRFVGALEERARPDRRDARRAAGATSTPTSRRATSSTCWRAWLGVDLDESQTIGRPARDRAPRRPSSAAGAAPSTGSSWRCGWPSRTCRCASRTRAACVWSTDRRPGAARAPSFVVYCDKPIRRGRQAAVARCIERCKPVHTTYRLRVKAPKKKPRRMRTCQSCGRENPDDQDFCECGEYLRWEPTGYMPAVTPTRPRAEPAAAARAAPAAAARPRADAAAVARARPGARAPPPAATAAAPPPPPRRRAAARASAAPPAAAARRAAPRRRARAATPPVRGAVPRRRPPSAATPRRRRAGHDHPAPARRRARARRGARPRRRPRRPRARARRSCATRARSSTTTTCACEGLPAEWCDDPPRTPSTSCPSAPAAPTSRRSRSTSTRRATPEAEAKLWELQVVAHLGPQRPVAASAPLILGIQPYEEFEPQLKPERASGRRKAGYDVTVRNKANAPGHRRARPAGPDDDAVRLRVPRAAAEVDPRAGEHHQAHGQPPRSASHRPRRTRRASRCSPRRARRARRCWPPRTRSPRARSRSTRWPSPAASASAQGLVEAQAAVLRPRVYRPRMSQPNLYMGPRGSSSASR